MALEIRRTFIQNSRRTTALLTKSKGWNVRYTLVETSEPNRSAIAKARLNPGWMVPIPGIVREKVDKVKSKYLGPEESENFVTSRDPPPGLSRL